MYSTNYYKLNIGIFYIIELSNLNHLNKKKTLKREKSKSEFKKTEH